jgi:DNA replication and repair protein RecF
MSALTRLSLSDFRSYSDALIAPSSGLVILTGDNGAGKTNVLEAISLLSPGRGLRRASLSEIARSDGPGGFAVAAQLAGVDLGTGTTAAAPERRQVRINGAAASATSLAEWLSVLWLTPAMDRLFLEGVGGRRRFLDRLVLALSSAHAMHAARYEAAMRARNKLLGEEGRPDGGWLSALEARMAEHGCALAEARAETVEALSVRLSDAPDGPFARAGLTLDGWTSKGTDVLLRDLAAGRSRDSAAGRTLSGPHRPISSSRTSTRTSLRIDARQGSRRRCSSGSSSPMPIWLQSGRAAADPAPRRSRCTSRCAPACCAVRTARRREAGRFG